MKISLADLDIGLGPVTKKELEALNKKKRPDTTLRRATDPWRVEGVILVIQETTCSCGTVYRAPAADNLLVRFRHKKSGMLWEIAEHPAMLNKNVTRLPHRIMQGTVTNCEACWEVKHTEHQLDMFMSEGASNFMHELLEELSTCILPN